MKRSGSLLGCVTASILRVEARSRVMSATLGEAPETDVERLTPVKTFDSLFDELSERAASRPEGSGTVAALDAGVHHIGKKVIEEAGEVWIAAEYESDEELSGEISQLLYWLQVMMIKRGLTPADVYRHL